MVVDYTDGGTGGKSGGWIDAVNGRKFWLFGRDVCLEYNDVGRFKRANSATSIGVKRK